MKNRLQNSMIAIVATIAAAALAATPALAKDSKKPVSHKSAAAAAAAMGHVPAVQEAPKKGQHDEKPGPAWRTVGGTVKEIKDNSYTVEDFEVRHYGDVALLSGRTHMTGTYKGEPFRSHYRYIDIYVRRDGRWKIVSVQISRIPDPAP